ncbi:MAG: TonB-dependent receptor [Deltaproteobacteria bacterium]|nr:TonB-dependent receptor [Deltaproteobacteria bacterium]
MAIPISTPSEAEIKKLEFRRRCSKRFLAQATAFSTEVVDLIEADASSGTFENIAETTSKGIESTVSLGPFFNVSAVGHHLYNEAYDEEDKETQLPFRPKNTFKYHLDYNDNRIFGTVGGIFVSEREDPVPIIDESGDLQDGELERYQIFYAALSGIVYSSPSCMKELKLFRPRRQHSR